MIDYYNQEKIVSQYLTEGMEIAARERLAMEASTRLADQQRTGCPGSVGKFRPTRMRLTSTATRS
jgi:hypothetical protein